jgi:hypothetical protein
MLPLCPFKYPIHPKPSQYYSLKTSKYPPTQRWPPIRSSSSEHEPSRSRSSIYEIVARWRKQRSDPSKFSRTLIRFVLRSLGLGSDRDRSFLLGRTWSDKKRVNIACLLCQAVIRSKFWVLSWWTSPRPDIYLEIPRDFQPEYL